jgi:hypothetical protein
MSGVVLDDLKKIGFNEPVDVDGRSLHVQTEVLTRGGVVIRTIILESGVAKVAEDQPCPDITNLGAFIALVESQHKQVVRQLQRHGPTWPASTR